MYRHTLSDSACLCELDEPEVERCDLIVNLVGFTDGYSYSYPGVDQG
jgi:hypothetical protein